MPKRSPEQKKIYEANKKAMYKRDNWHCKSCNSTFNLTPHHIKHRGQCGGDELENLVTLCIRCHDAVHDGFLKAYRTTRDNVVFLRMRGWKP